MIIKFGDGAAPQKSPWLFHHLRYLSIIIFVKVLIFLNIDVVLGSVSHWEGDSEFDAGRFIGLTQGNESFPRLH